jgi:hypothetical protein
LNNEQIIRELKLTTELTTLYKPLSRATITFFYAYFFIHRETLARNKKKTGNMFASVGNISSPVVPLLISIEISREDDTKIKKSCTY